MTEPAGEPQRSGSRIALRHSIALIATAALATAIAYLTLSPPNEDPVGLLSDKVYHVLAFAALAFPTALLYARSLIWTLPAAMTFGGAIELIQPFVGRQNELGDFVADIVGLGIGTVLGLVLRARVLKRYRRQYGNTDRFKTHR